jgi:protein-S-isoprenylcysteine O-methyltransferase Ste14
MNTLFLYGALFLAAGRLRWAWGWAYVGVGVGILILNLVVLPREVVAERGQRRKKDVKTWDRLLSPLIFVPALGTPVVAALDWRWGWTGPLPELVHVAGLACITLGQGLFTWAMASNKFFSTVVRIQVDRDHAVTSDGPYRYVRHPGYVGYIVSLFGTAVGLGSWWALLPAGLAAGMFVVRTALEDTTLRRELPGYAEYAQHTRYRLLPGVW